MKVKLKELKQVWDAYGFLKFPRMVGDPIQTPVYNEQEFIKWFASNTGRAICFISHNSYEKLDQRFNPPTVLSVSVDNLFTDFDDKDKPENAQLDTIKLVKFCQKEELPFINSFSGSKGFHHYIRLKPSIHSYDEELKSKIRAVHNWLKDKQGLRTMDGKCKEPRRLCRIPMSRYAREGKHREYTIGETYCHPISPDDIMDMPISEIIKNAKNPTLHVPKLQTARLDLDGFISKFDIDILEYSAEKDCVNGELVASSREYMKDWPDIADEQFTELIKTLIPRMCVHNDLLNRNPLHATRRMAVIQLKEIGYEFSQVVALFEQMGEKFKWVDRVFRQRRIYQIKHIYFHHPKYMHDTCGKIKMEHGLCVGEECPKFRGW